MEDKYQDRPSLIPDLNPGACNAKQKCPIWVGIFCFTLTLFGLCVMLLMYRISLGTCPLCYRLL
jgi:hypothetical protein